MKYRLSIAVMAVTLLLAALTWFVSREQGTTIRIVTTAVPLAAAVGTSPATPAVAAAPLDLPPRPTILAAPVSSPRRLPALPPQRPSVNALPADVDGTSRHVARPGETLTSLAHDLLGDNTQTNRDALVEANTGLQADPDRLVAGQTYFIPPGPDAPAQPFVAKVAPTLAATVTAHPASKSHPAAAAGESDTELRYVAATGDTVSNMAAAFLGGDGKAQKDAIIGANASLRANPDRVVAGKAYRIPAPDGMSASTSDSSSAKQVPTRPTTQPDADDLVLAGSPRVLRYTARAGDTLTSMTIALLGLDTPEARNGILISNPSLKQDPDHLVTGQTYWIPAPTGPAAAAAAAAAPQKP
jgi:hypothetical protein